MTMNSLGILQQVARIGGGLRRTIDDNLLTAPESNQFRARDAYHLLLRAFYANTIYEDARIWQQYKARYRLPRATRSIYNPTRRAVDFYSGAVYPGAWTEDGRAAAGGRPSAIRFAEETLAARPALVTAAMQALTWGNWAAERMVYVREMAKLGSVFVEVIDDLERRKVYPQVTRLDWLDDLDLDASGNVQSYRLVYQAWDDETERPYRYRKDVDRETITEYRDDVEMRQSRNDYGFAPAAWVRFRHVGGVFGAPAIDGVIPKIDEANRLASGIHNYIAQLQKQPAVFWSNSSPVPISAEIAKLDAPTSELTAASIEESMMWLWSNDPNGKVTPFLTPVPVEGAGVRLDKLMEEIEDDLPEIALSKDLRQMTQVSGPGAERIVSDVAAKLYEAEANADAGLIKVMQMCVAVGGWRLANGDWGGASRQQAKFDGFDLASYDNGDLDLSLVERPLLEQTDTERMNALTLKKAVAGLPDAAIQHELGYSPEQIAQFGQAADAQAQRSVVGQF